MKKFYRQVGTLTLAALFAGIVPEGVSAKAVYASVTLAPDSYANATRNYYEGSGGFTSSGKFISAADFMAMGGWKNIWQNIADWQDSSAENILTFKDVDYCIRLADPKTSAVKSGFATPNSKTDISVNIDVPDGEYYGISLLGGADSSASSAKGVLRFNYSDGTDSGWIEYDQAKVSVENDEALAVPAKKYSANTVNDDGYIYLHQINVPGDVTKTTESVDFLVRNALLKDDGSVELKATTGQVGYRYYSRYAAMTMLADLAAAEKAKIMQIDAIIKTLPSVDNFEFTDENMQKLAEIRDIRNTVDDTGITDQSYLDILDSADKYIRLLEEADIRKNNEKIKQLGAKLDELPPVAELVLSQEVLEKLDEAEEIYKTIDLTLTIDEEHMKVLDKLSEYKAKMKELQKGENDKKAEQLAEITKALPPLEEFEKTETYTDEVLEKLKEIKQILDAMDDTAGVSAEYEETVKLAKQYAEKSDYVYVLENNTISAEIEKYMSELPPAEKFEYTRANESKIEKISRLRESLHTAYMTEEHKKTAEKAEQYIALLKNFPPVSQVISPDSFVNFERTFYESSSAVFDSYGVDWQKYMQMDIWNNPWDIASNVGDNTLTFGDVTYRVRLVTEQKAIKSIYSSTAGTTVGYETIPVPEGKYTGISLLGGAAHAGGQAGVAFNYSDGTSSAFIARSIAKMNVQSKDALEIPAIKYDNATGKTTAASLYLYQHNFDNPNPEKTVVSVSIPYRNVTIENGELKIQPTSGAYAYAYWTRWFGMSMLQSTKDYKDRISREFKALEGIDEITEAVLAPVDSLVSNAESLGIDVSEIDGYDIYCKKGASIVRILGYDESADLKTAEVNVRFAANVAVSENDITLLDSQGKAVGFELIAEGKAVRIRFKNIFDYTGKYTLTISKNITANGNAMGRDVQYSFAVPKVVAFSAFSAEKNGDKLDVSFMLDNDGKELTDAMVTLCVITADGRLCDSAIMRARDIKQGENLAASNISLTVPEGTKLKVFVLDNIEKMNTIYKYEY